MVPRVAIILFKMAAFHRKDIVGGKKGGKYYFLISGEKTGSEPFFSCVISHTH
jgi:hypothetical protein